MGSFTSSIGSSYRYSVPASFFLRPGSGQRLRFSNSFRRPFTSFRPVSFHPSSHTSLSGSMLLALRERFFTPADDDGAELEFYAAGYGLHLI